MNRYLVILFLTICSVTIYGQDKILEDYSTSEFTEVDWFDDLADHLAMKNILNDDYEEVLDSIIFTGADQNVPQFKRSYFVDNKTEIQASSLWVDEWQPSFFRKYKYEGVGGLLSECSLHFDWDGSVGNWDQEATYKNAYNYDDDGRLLSIEYNTTISGLPDAVSDIEVFEYNSENIIGATYFSVLEDGTLVNDFKSDFKYNDEQLVYSTRFVWYQEKWVPNDSISYKYNDNGEIFKRDFYTLYFWQDEPVIFKESYEYYYNEDGSVRNIYHYENYDTTSNTFANLEITEYTILINGNQESYQNWFIYEDGQKDEFPFKEDIYEYDRNLLFEKIRYPRNLLFEEKSRSHQHKILLGRGYDGLDGTEWPPLELGKYSMFYYYSPLDDGTFTEELSDNLELGLYPNPATDYLIIAAKNTQSPSNNGALEIYETDGRMIMYEKDVYNGSRINMSSLAKGLYYYKLSFGSAVLNGSVIKM